MNLRPNWKPWEGPNLFVTRLCNMLKKKGYDEITKGLMLDPIPPERQIAEELLKQFNIYRN
jgi:hypothetical protein